MHRHEEAWCNGPLARLPAETPAALDALLEATHCDATGGKDGRAPLLALRAGAGQASLQSVGEEADKLARIRALALPADLFAGLPYRVLLAYRRRVAAEELHKLRRHPTAIRLTLLAAFCHARGREITDALVDLLIAIVHRIGAKAEKRVESELIADLNRVAIAQKGGEQYAFRPRQEVTRT